MSSDELIEMPFLRNIGFIMTYKCQVACPHCIIEAGPERKEEMLLSDAFNWIQQVANYREGYIKVLSLTGGEPFYNIDHLKKIATFGLLHKKKPLEYSENSLPLKCLPSAPMCIIKPPYRLNG
jgi:MoaA/NifB/PqqE/SkfB family radical SAM enzyme